MLKSLKFVAILGGCLALLAVIAGAVGATTRGTDAYLASGVAAAVVWLAGSLALIIASFPRDPFGRLNAVLLGMLIRMCLPLLAAVALSSLSSRLSAGGIVGFLVLHYLAGLVIETPMLLRLTRSTGSVAADSAAINSSPLSNTESNIGAPA